MPNALLGFGGNQNALTRSPFAGEEQPRNALMETQLRNALMMNPNLQRQGMAYRANMTPPDSVMDPRYPAWRQAQDQAEQMDVLSAFPGPAELASGAKALAAALLKSKVGGMMAPIVFHGSPHKFDQFDMSKIGTGEGAQAYGHGLYFAESPDVAKTYVTPNAYTAFDVLPEAEKRGFKLTAGARGELTRQAVANPDPMIAAKKLQYANAASREIPQEKLADLIAAYQESRKTASFYTVDLPDEAAARMLDWDKPLSQQPEGVRAAIAEYAKIAKPYDIPIDHDPTGAEIYGMLAAPREVGKKGATDALRNIGIPGIRYLDQGSRDAGKGTFNYVVFSDDLPKIIGRE